MNVTLRSIDRDNWHECIRLALKPEQEGFMPSNLFHIAEARFYPEWTLLGVYAGSRMVGFAMYGLDPDDMTVNFIHFMIDGKEQGKGYGKAALEQLLRKIRKGLPRSRNMAQPTPAEHGSDKALQRLTVSSSR